MCHCARVSASSALIGGKRFCGNRENWGSIDGLKNQPKPAKNFASRVLPSSGRARRAENDNTRSRKIRRSRGAHWSARGRAWWSPRASSAMGGRARGSSKPADVSGETTELLRGRDGASSSSDEESGESPTRRAGRDAEWSWAFVASYAAFGALVVVAVTYSTYLWYSGTAYVRHPALLGLVRQLHTITHRYAPLHHYVLEASPSFARPRAPPAPWQRTRPAPSPRRRR